MFGRENSIRIPWFGFSWDKWLTSGIHDVRSEKSRLPILLSPIIKANYWSGTVDGRRLLHDFHRGQVMSNHRFQVVAVVISSVTLTCWLADGVSLATAGEATRQEEKNKDEIVEAVVAIPAVPLIPAIRLDDDAAAEKESPRGKEYFILPAHTSRQALFDRRLMANPLS